MAYSQGNQAKGDNTDFALTVAQLCDKHARRTEHLQGLTRTTARNHYGMGVRDCLAELQKQAVSEETAAAAAQPPPPPSITGPLAVQPNHVAVPENSNEG